MANPDLRRISLVAFGRVTDNTLLGTWNSRNLGSAGNDERMPTIRKLLVAGKKRMVAGQRQKLAWERNAVYCLLDFPAGSVLYTVMVADDPESLEEYPERLAYQFLGELVKYVETNFSHELGREKKVEALSAQCATTITSLAMRFDDPVEADKVTQLQFKTNTVKNVMKNNIQQALAQTERLDVLDQDADAMESEAEDYQDKAEEIETYFWWKDCKVTFLLGLVVVCLIAVMIVCCVKRCK